MCLFQSDEWIQSEVDLPVESVVQFYKARVYPFRPVSWIHALDHYTVDTQHEVSVGLKPVHVEPGFQISNAITSSIPSWDTNTI